MSLLAKVSALGANSFLRSAGTLAGGTAAAQALTILSLPLLTRLYSPEDFNLLAVYVALLTMISVAACLRLEIAIPLPEHDGDAANLLALALVSAASVGAVLALLVALQGEALAHALSQPALQSYLWLLPLGVWLTGSYAAIQFWATRKRRFPAIARTRLMRAGTGVGVQLGLGWAGLSPFGLLLGHAIMSGAGVFGLGRVAWKQDRAALLQVRWAGLRKALADYRSFPKFSVLEAIANDAANQLPILLIAALAIGPEAGFLLLASRAMGTPVTLIGNAVAQVYLARAPEEERQGRLADFTTRVSSALAQVGVGPLVFAGMIAPPAFALVFGEEWRRAGELVTWMTPWFILKLVASPVSMVMHVRMMQRAMLALMLSGLALRVLATAGAYRIDAEFVSQGYAISGALFYGMALLVYLKSAGAGWRGLKRVIGAALISGIVGLGLGYAGLYALAAVGV